MCEPLTKERDEIIFEPRKEYAHKPNQNATYDAIIIGLGIAGLSAAMYAARLGLKVLAIGEMEGGTITLTGPVENYPGFVSIKGQTLAKLIENHAMDYDVDVLVDRIDRIARGSGKNALFSVHSGKKSFPGRAVILATGVEPKKLGIEGETRFLGNGVSYCALCDLTLVKGKNAVVVGGGDSAVKEANLLAHYAKKVFIVNNEPALHPEKPNMDKAQDYVKKGKITIINSNELLEIGGTRRVEKAVLKNPFQGKRELEVDWVFIYVGHSSASALAKGLGAALNKKDEVIVNRDCETNIPGFYAAGDVTDLDWKQAIVGAAQGVTAAYRAYKYVSDNFGVI
jgi:thioredoxin reductase (NADPH)